MSEAVGSVFLPEKVFRMSGLKGHELPSANSKPALVNFLLGAATIGNNSDSLTEGLLDSRCGLSHEVAQMVVAGSLNQLIVIAEQVRSEGIELLLGENNRLLFAVLQLNGIRRLWRHYSKEDYEPIILKRIADEINIWGETFWVKEWDKFSREGSQGNNRVSLHYKARGEYKGADFVGARIGAINRERIDVPEYARQPWNDIADLRRFWDQHRMPSRIQIYLEELKLADYSSPFY